MKLKLIFSAVILFFSMYYAFGQCPANTFNPADEAPPADHSSNLYSLYPETNDCAGSPILCPNMLYKFTTCSGSWDGEITPSTTCSYYAENGSHWFHINVIKSGVIAFKIIPVNLDDNYDFSIYKNVPCWCINGIDDTHIKSTSWLDANNVQHDVTYFPKVDLPNSCPSSLVNPISCNFCDKTGITGLSSSATANYQINTSGCTLFNPLIQANAGDSFILYISYHCGDEYCVPSANSICLNGNQGFRIDFSGSTAEFMDFAPPTIQSVVAASSSSPACELNSLNLKFSGNIQKSSVATSDFSLKGADGSTYTITSVFPNTAHTRTYSNSYTINFTPAITNPQNLILSTTSNILDACGNVFPPSDIPVTFTPGLNLALSKADNTCDQNSIKLCVPSSATGTYQWYKDGVTLGQTNSCITVNEHGIYTVTVTNSSGCTQFSYPFIIN